MDCSTNCGIEVQVATQCHSSARGLRDPSSSKGPVGAAFVHGVDSSSEAATATQREAESMMRDWDVADASLVFAADAAKSSIIGETTTASWCTGVV